jgi:hypothetical protein
MIFKKIRIRKKLASKINSNIRVYNKNKIHLFSLIKIRLTIKVSTTLTMKLKIKIINLKVNLS